MHAKVGGSFRVGWASAALRTSPRIDARDTLPWKENRSSSRAGVADLSIGWTQMTLDRLMAGCLAVGSRPGAQTSWETAVAAQVWNGWCVKITEVLRGKHEYGSACTSGAT